MLWGWFFRERAHQVEDQSPLVGQLRAEVSYLRAERTKDQERFERLEMRYRDELIALANRHVAAELDWRRQPGPAAPRLMPEGQAGPGMDLLTARLHANASIEEEEPIAPENYGVTEDELAERTIEAEARRREEERLATVEG